MKNNLKSVLISPEVHEKLKKTSEKSGIKIKVLVETGIMYYLNHIKINEENDGTED